LTNSHKYKDFGSISYVSKRSLKGHILKKYQTCDIDDLYKLV